MKFFFKFLFATLLISPFPTIHATDNFVVEEVATDLSFPWSLAFLPNGDFLISEKTGALVRVSADGKSKTTISDKLRTCEQATLSVFAQTRGNFR